MALLTDLLSRGPQPVACCLAVGAAHGISQGTMRAARRRLPLECERAYFGRGVSRWILVAGKARPARWRPAKARHCVRCGVSLVARHWHTRRCSRCRLKVNAARARAKY